MTLRCKDGDIAIIIHDTDNCLENIGRLVHVRGPAYRSRGMTVWLICPVTTEPYCFTDLDGSTSRETVTWESEIIHEDAWMTPIRSDGIEDADFTAEERVLAVEQTLEEV